MEQTSRIRGCRLKIISMGKKLFLPLVGMKPEIIKDEEWILLDRQVLGVIRLTLLRSVAHNAMKEKTNSSIRPWLI